MVVLLQLLQLIACSLPLMQAYHRNSNIDTRTYEMMTDHSLWVEYDVSGADNACGYRSLFESNEAGRQDGIKILLSLNHSISSDDANQGKDVKIRIMHEEIYQRLFEDYFTLLKYGYSVDRGSVHWLSRLSHDDQEDFNELIHLKLHEERYNQTTQDKCLEWCQRESVYLTYVKHYLNTPGRMLSFEGAAEAVYHRLGSMAAIAHGRGKNLRIYVQPSHHIAKDYHRMHYLNHKYDGGFNETISIRNHGNHFTYLKPKQDSNPLIVINVERKETVIEEQAVMVDSKKYRLADLSLRDVDRESEPKHSVSKGLTSKIAISYSLSAIDSDSCCSMNQDE